MDERYEALRRPPEDALKPIEFGALKGKSDINPQWKYEALTEVFGLCGVGWKFEIIDQQIHQVPTGEVMIFVTVNLYVKDGDKWSDPVPGCGGDFIVKKDKNGIRGNDEAMKMAVTDALGNACKMVGVAADIYRGRYDSKYGKYTEPEKPAQKENVRRENKKTAQSNMAQKPENKQTKEPQTVKDYYALTVDWARNNKAVTYIGPLLQQKFKKSRFEELTLVEAKAFYANIKTLVDDARRADDAALMDGVG